MSERVPLYDSFSREYDAMVSWQGRLQREWPFLKAQFESVGARRVLDVGTGTGMHAVWFAQNGLDVVATDPSEEMLRKARENAGALAGVSFVQASLRGHAGKVDGPFDAITCLGNTLPHVLTQQGLREAVADLRSVLKPGGVLIVQQLNYDRILATRQRFLGLSSGSEAGEELLFFRFYDFPERIGPDSQLTFNVAILRRTRDGWTYRVEATRLLPIRADQLTGVLSESGFGRVATFGSYAGDGFQAASSGDLIVVAWKVSE